MSFNHLFSQFTLPLTQLRQLILLIGLMLTLMVSSGCTALNRLNPRLSAPPLELSIVQIEPRGGGSYSVSGNTTLPDQTRITVSAIRLFKTTAASSSNYAILDRQIAVVNQGSWETRLNLWQASQNGQFQESWQATRELDRRSDPEPSVTFLATLEPANQAATLQQQVEALDPSTQAAITRFTTDGELYLQASNTLTVPPPPRRPADSATATSSKPIQPQTVKPNSNSDAPESGRQRQIDTPLASDAFLR